MKFLGTSNIGGVEFQVYEDASNELFGIATDKSCRIINLEMVEGGVKEKI